jgi:hypothetical protein
MDPNFAQIVAPPNSLKNWLRAGAKGGLRRKIVAWGTRRFRKSSTIFYTVQNTEDATRLCGDGAPWPTDASRAHLGPGVYSWTSRFDAQKYLNSLSNMGVTDLEHVLKIPN